MVEPARRVRLDDVAAEVGLSTASVSLVLRGVPGPSAATREKVLEAASRLGYRPDRAASRLAARRSRLIGVMMDVRSSFHAEVVADLHEPVERLGYDLVLSTITRGRDEQRAVETLLDSRCEALVLLGAEAPAERLAALDRQVPVVLVGRRLDEPSGGTGLDEPSGGTGLDEPSGGTGLDGTGLDGTAASGETRVSDGLGVDVVRVADDVGIAQTVAHLVALGHRDIAYLDGGSGTIPAIRREGYRSAMAELGLTPMVLAGGRDEEAGIAAAGALLGGGSPLPTAVTCFNDRSAVGLMDRFIRAGVDVPGEVSVTGYDDDPVARLAHIALTTISQGTRRLSEHAMNALVDRLDGGRTEHREVVLPPHLVVRRTTGPPRSA